MRVPPLDALPTSLINIPVHVLGCCLFICLLYQIMSSLKTVTSYKSPNMYTQDLTLNKYFDSGLGEKIEAEGKKKRKETLDEEQ